MTEPHMYSILDLVQVKGGEFSEKLRMLVQEALAHVANCVVSTVIIILPIGKGWFLNILIRVAPVVVNLSSKETGADN